MGAIPTFVRLMPNDGLKMPLQGSPRRNRPLPAALTFKLLFPIMIITLIGLIPLKAGADWSPLIDRMVRDGHDEITLRALFARPEVRFDPDPMSQKIESLIRRQFRKPSEEQYEKSRAIYKGYLKPEVIDRAYVYSRENSAILKKMQERYCVPPEVVVSILLVETSLGRNTGSKKAFNVLASMAVARDLETIQPFLAKEVLNADNEDYARRRCREKADWAYHELKSLILYAENNRLDPLEIPGSIYGAIGLCQFMPSNVPAYGVDADGDGRIDLFDRDEALHSIGKYLSRHGWRCNITRKRQHRVVMAYNHSHIYANTVLSIAEKLRSKAQSEKQKAGQDDRI